MAEIQTIVPTYDSKKTVIEQITGKDAYSRACVKSQAIASKVGSNISFQRDNVSIVVTDLQADKNRIIFNVSATKDGKPLPVSNPFIIQNPPIATGSGSTELGTRVVTEDPINVFKDTLGHIIQVATKGVK